MQQNPVLEGAAPFPEGPAAGLPEPVLIDDRQPASQPDRADGTLAGHPAEPGTTPAASGLWPWTLGFLALVLLASLVAAALLGRSSRQDRPPANVR